MNDNCFSAELRHEQQPAKGAQLYSVDVCEDQVGLVSRTLSASTQLHTHVPSAYRAPPAWQEQVF